MRWMLLLAIVAPLAGCLMEAVTVTAIQGELAAQNASSATRTLSYAKDSQAKTEIQHAVRTFAAEKGRNPYSLEELIPQYLPEMKLQSNGQPFGYDPATGTVSSGLAAQQPGPMRVPAMTDADRRNVESIRDAIYSYWQATGYYPPSLESLAPLYIQQVPVMSNGQPFIYDPQTGGAYHPAELAPAPGSGASGPVSQGSDPNAISGQHSQRQMQVLNDLNLQ